MTTTDAATTVDDTPVPDPTVDPRVHHPECAESLWAEAVLGHDDPEVEWYDDRVDSVPVKPWDVDSVLCALEDLGPEAQAAFDSERGRVPVPRVRVAVAHDTTRRCAAAGVNHVFRRGSDVAILWVRAWDGDGSLACVATSDEYRDELLETVMDLAGGPCSTWRGQAVSLDPGERRGFRHLPPRRPEPPPPSLRDGLRRNLVLPLRQFHSLGVHVPRRGVLLHGRPGTGKSWALEWVISEVAGSVSVIVATPSVVGNGPFMRHAFDMAVAAAPALLILEDLDVGSGHRMLNPASFGELLNSMDGPGRTPGVFVAATTNHPELLDPAISQRPGRFDVILEVAEAPEEARRRAVEALAADLGIADDDEVSEVVRRTKGFSMAEIAAIGQMAWLESADTGEPPSLIVAMARLAVEAPTAAADSIQVGYA